MDFKTPRVELNFLRGVFVLFVALFLGASPIAAKYANMGSQVEICSGLGSKWIAVSDEFHPKSNHGCIDCVVIAPLSNQEISPFLVTSERTIELLFAARSSLRSDIISQNGNKDPPIMMI